MKNPNQDRDKKLISYYLLGYSLRETGKEFNLTGARVQQILIANQIPRHEYGIITKIQKDEFNREAFEAFQNG